MKYFDHIYIPEQVILALGIQTSGLLRELYKVHDEKPDYALGKVLEILKSSYLNDEKKQQQVRQLIGMLTQKYGQHNVNIEKLKEALLLYFLMKAVRDFIYTSPKGSTNSPEELVAEFLDFLSYRKAKQKLGGTKIKSLTIIPDEGIDRGSISNHSGYLEKILEQHFGKMELLLTTFKNIGLTEIQIETGIKKFLHFDLDILLFDLVYADFYSFITKNAIPKTNRYLVMYDIFLITHDHLLTTPSELATFRDLDSESLEKDPEFRTHRLNEVGRILRKKDSKSSVKKYGDTP